MATLFKYIVVISLSFSWCVTSAQSVYPVSIQMQMPATSTVYFQDMWKVSPASLQASVVLNDLQEPYLDVYLRIQIEGVGMTIQTNPSVPVMPIRIYPGMPYFLTAQDWDAVFQSSRLLFKGYERSSWIRQLPFPEGNYRLEIEVVEWKSNVVVSNVAMQYTWLMLQDPPMLVFPTNEQVLEVTQPQWITFQWAPMHLLPISYAVTYEFSLHKIYPSSLSPWQAVENTFPVYRVTTQQPFLVYGMAEPPLQKGAVYAWRVKVMSNGNPQCFKNNGYSTIYIFQYGPPCTTPTIQTITQENTQRVHMDWSEEASSDLYEIDYRVLNTNEWIHVSSDSNEYVFTRWQAATSYEVKVRSVCGVSTTDWSAVQRFQTGDQNAFKVQRCSPTAFQNIQTNNTLSILYVNDVFTINGFKVKVLSIYGSSSSYSGYGVAYIPFMGVPVRMQLIDIAVSNGRAVQGKAVAVKADLSAYRVTSMNNSYSNFCTDDVLNPSTTSSRPATTGPNTSVYTPLQNAFVTDVDQTMYYIVNETMVWSENTSMISSSKDTVSLKSIAPSIQIGQTIQVVSDAPVIVQSIRTMSLPTSALGCLRSLVDTILLHQQDSILTQLPTWKQNYEEDRNSYQETLTQQYRWSGSDDSDYTFQDLSINDSSATHLNHTITPEMKQVLMADSYWKNYFTQYEAWQIKKRMLEEKAVISIYIEEHPEASSKIPLYTFSLHQVESIADWELRTRQALCGLDIDWTNEVFRKFLPHLLIDLQNWE